MGIMREKIECRILPAKIFPRAQTHPDFNCPGLDHQGNSPGAIYRCGGCGTSLQITSRPFIRQESQLAASCANSRPGPDNISAHPTKKKLS